MPYHFEEQTIVCKDCGKETPRKAGNQLYCSDCAIHRNRESALLSYQKQDAKQRKEKLKSVPKQNTEQQDRHRLKRMAWDVQADGWDELFWKVYDFLPRIEYPQKAVCACQNVSRRQCGACKTIYCDRCKPLKHPVCPKKGTP